MELSSVYEWTRQDRIGRQRGLVSVLYCITYLSSYASRRLLVASPQSSFLIPHSSVLSPQSSVLSPQSSVLSPQFTTSASSRLMAPFSFSTSHFLSPRYSKYTSRLLAYDPTRAGCRALNVTPPPLLPPPPPLRPPPPPLEDRDCGWA